MKNLKIPSRVKDSYKGDFGHVFVLAGSLGMTGAAYLSSQAALVSGSGLVTLGIPKSLNDIMEIKLTEVMTVALEETTQKTVSLKAKKNILLEALKADVCAIGPGLSTNKGTVELIKKLLPIINKPVVLDADGLNALASNVDILKKRKAPTVVTPHIGEMKRLLGNSKKDVKNFKENVAKEFALKYNVVVVLKGHNTAVASCDGKIFVNNTGNSGMSTAGSGDVLTGMIASFIGQGFDPYGASVLAVHMHGKAGDIVAKEKGQFSLIATDLINILPQVFKEIV